jgi:hypothetical protein
VCVVPVPIASEPEPIVEPDPTDEDELGDTDEDDDPAPVPDCARTGRLRASAKEIANNFFILTSKSLFQRVRSLEVTLDFYHSQFRSKNEFILEKCKGREIILSKI